MRSRPCDRSRLLVSAGLLAAVLLACGGSGGGGGGGAGPENLPPRLSIQSPDEVTVVELGASRVVRIAYVDGDSDDQALTSFFADRDGELGTTDDQVPISIDRPDGDDAPQTLDWETSAVPGGTYRIIGRISDGKNPPVVSEAPGNVTIRYLLSGLCFSPYTDGQDPNLGSVIDETQVRERLRIVAPYTKLIRSFGVSDGLEHMGRIAHELGLQAAVGAWLGADLDENREQIDNLVDQALAGHVDLAIVGSEVLLRGDLTEAQLLGYLAEVGQALAGRGIPVTTAETHGQLLDHPDVLDACDVILVNYYPYWEGFSPDLAVAAVHGWHQRIVAAAGGKPVVVSETGWPSGGDAVGDAVASPENAAAYFLNFVSWARANSVEYYYFSALDEGWKAAVEGPQGAHWGLWDRTGVQKPGMAAVFDGETVPDNWSAPSIPGGPGTPALELTVLPAKGSFDDLEGRAWHVAPADHRVAVYIKVAGGWWTKPTFASPATTIRVDGRFTCDITTGGNDETATDVAAYLIPAGSAPPIASGESGLPASLATIAVASVQVGR